MGEGKKIKQEAVIYNFSIQLKKERLRYQCIVEIFRRIN